MFSLPDAAICPILCRISLFSPSSAASTAKMKKNLAPLQVVKDKMKIIRTKGLEVC